MSASESTLQRTAEHVRGKPVRAFQLLVLASLGSAVLALVIFGWLGNEVLAGKTAHFDLQVRLWAHQFTSPAMTNAMRALSFIGSAPVLLAASVVLVVVFWMRWSRRAAVWLAVSMLGASVLDLTLKHVFHRTRPEPFFGTPLPHSYSFPSGHALASFCFFGVLAGLMMTRISSPVVRVVIWCAAALMIAAIGFSRIYLGVHYPTDVLAGYAAAAVWVSAVIAVDRSRTRRNAG